MSDAEANFTPDEQAAFDRVIATFGPDITVGEFEPWGPDDPPPKPKVFQEADQALEDDPDERFRLVPLDFPTLLAGGIPDPNYLDAPYLLRGARVWAFGPAESCKTLYFEWVAARLTRQGKTVVFISAENPLSTDVDRIGRLRPDFEGLRFYHMPGLDLADRSHFVELAEACLGADLLVADTLSALWSGDEASNAEVVKLDREVLAQLVRLTGVTPVVIHHTGHPTAFVNRSGVGAGRGASAMGQKGRGPRVPGRRPARVHDRPREEPRRGRAQGAEGTFPSRGHRGRRPRHPTGRQGDRRAGSRVHGRCGRTRQRIRGDARDQRPDKSSEGCWVRRKHDRSGPRRASL